MKIRASILSMLFLSFVCLFSLVVSAPVQAAVYYVDVNNGLNTNDGTATTSAWQTIEYAVAQLADNDQLNVVPGTYVPVAGASSDAVTVNQNGVTIQGEPGVIIDGGGTGGPTCWSAGFNISGSNVIINSLEISGFDCDGTIAVLVSSGNNNSIEGCRIHDNNTGIDISSNASSTKVIESSIFSNGSGVVTSSSVEIASNKLWDNSSNIYADISIPATTVDIVNNLIYYNSLGDYGVYFYTFDSSFTARIYHNTIVGVTNGIYMFSYETFAVINADIRFNVISGTTGPGISFSNFSGGSFSGSIDYNDVINCNPNYSGNGVSAGVNDVSKDPHFVDAAGLDFHLAPTSWLLNLIRAEAGDVLADDLDGVVRPKGLGREMGCYEIADTRALWVYDAGAANTRLVLPDINADGYDELLLHVDPIGDQVDTTLRVISGADGLTQLWSYQLPQGRKGMALIDDLDNDTIKDIIVITGTSGNGIGQISVISPEQIMALSGADGGEIWTEPLVVSYGFNFPVVVSDINGDGYADIFGNTISPDAPPPYSGGDNAVHISGKDGTILWNIDSAIWDIYGRTAAPDQNGDLKNFLVSGATNPTSGGVEVWQGGGASGVLAWSALTSENITNPAVVGDLNGDGVPEIAGGKFHSGTTCPSTPDPRLYVLNGATGDPLWDYGLQRTPSTIGNLGDISADGVDDVVIGTRILNSCGGTDGGVFALEGNPGAGTRLIWSYPLIVDSYVLVVPDANGDGKKDVLVTGQINELLLLSGVDGSELSRDGFPDTIAGAQPGEFDGSAGEDVLVNYGYHTYALTVQRSGTGQNNPPVTPIAVSPANETILSEAQAATLTLQASAFSDTDGDTHAVSYWELERYDSQEHLPSYMDGPNQNGLTSHPVTDFLEPGLKYAWHVKYEDDRGAASGWSAMSTFKVGTPVAESLPAVAAGTTQADYGMISIVHWPNDPSPSKVFNIQYDPRHYKIGTYDPVNSRYIEFGGSLVIEPGKAYWMLAREGITVNFNGIPVSTTTPTIEVSLYHNGNTLAPDGWNMIAPPNNASYTWGDVEAGVWIDETGFFIPPVPISTLTDDTIVDRRIWVWQNGSYVSHDNTGTFLLEPYKGYWVKAAQEGAYLVFPHVAQLAGVSAPDKGLTGLVAKVGLWLKNLVTEPRQAMADNDNPPMPMGALDDNDTSAVFGGCFVDTTSEFLWF